MGYTLASYFGEGALISSAIPVVISIGDGRAQTTDITASGQHINMPDASLFTHTGGVMFKFYNLGSNSYEVRYPDETLIGTLAAMQAGSMYLSGNPGDVRRWHMKITSIEAHTPTGTTGGNPGEDPGTGRGDNIGVN